MGLMVSGIRELLLSKKFFILDGDGTLYLWDKALPGSKGFIERIRELNREFIILSNNDSESKKNRLRSLKNLLDVEINENELLLTNELVEDFLAKRKIKKFDGLISNDFKEELLEHGFYYDEVNPDLLLIGFDVNLNYDKIVRIINHINNGKKFILTHIDPLCPYKGGKAIPDAGIISYMITASTGKKPWITLGKPFKSTISYILNKYNVKKKDCIIIGDRLGTDIKMANESKIDSIWLTASEKNSSSILKKSNYKPNFSVKSIYEVYKIIKNL